MMGKLQDLHTGYTQTDLTPQASVAGVEGAVVVGKLLELVERDGDTNIGYNAATNTYEDLVKAGIIDPVKVSLLVVPARHLGHVLPLDVRCGVHDAAGPASHMLLRFAAHS